MIKNNFVTLYIITSIILLNIGTNYNLAMENYFDSYLNDFNTFEHDITPHEQIFFEMLTMNNQQLPAINEQIFNNNNTLLSNISKKHPREEKTPQNQKNYKKQKIDTSQEKENPSQKQNNNLSTTKSFSCPECNKTFKRQQDLHEHIQLHSNQPSYTCSHCNAIFKLKNTLYKHIQAKHTKNKEYPCSYTNCDKIFKTKSGLTAHIAAKHENIRYNCSQCSKIFIKKNTLKIHVNKIHKK